MSLFLNAQELHELTGYKKPGRQIVWLRSQGFTFRISADGHPRVDRSHYLKLMGGMVESQHIKTEPDFRGLLKVVGVA